jgi:hypothetical protein
VIAGAKGCDQVDGAEGVVVAVPLAGPPDPDVLGRVGMQVPTERPALPRAQPAVVTNP